MRSFVPWRFTACPGTDFALIFHLEIIGVECIGALRRGYISRLLRSQIRGLFVKHGKPLIQKWSISFSHLSPQAYRVGLYVHLKIQCYH